MENELKSIQLNLDYYDQDGKHSLKPMSVKVNKIKDISNVGYQRRDTKYAMTFSLVIPAHIHAYLLGKVVPVFGMNDRNTTKEYKDDFSKTLNSDAIEKLCDMYLRVMADYVWLKDIENANLEKVIFYKLQNNASELNSSWNGLRLGLQSNLKYSFFIGYVATIKEKTVRYNEAKMVIHSSYDSEMYAYKYVKWAEARELFFESLQKSFETIINNLNAFEKNINEESVDLMLSDNNILRLT